MRVYLDHNASTPLRPEARDAMIGAMDLVGNPSSVHAEGREAKGLIEKARAQVAELAKCAPSQVIFTSGATEAGALAVAQKSRHGDLLASLPNEHDCLLTWNDEHLHMITTRSGIQDQDGIASNMGWMMTLLDNGRQSNSNPGALLAVSAANGETGTLGYRADIIGDILLDVAVPGRVRFAVVCDLTQAIGRIDLKFEVDLPSYGIFSAHKLGGPKGVGALINYGATDPTPILRGGGQEMGRRAGTENVIGIAGFGAAAEAARRDIAEGKWQRVQELRDILEADLAAASSETIFVGKEGARLPNTSCVITPGWKGETQVMQMDLSGFAISAGSACSSGKIRASHVLRSMGFSEEQASSAIRVSLGLETTEDEIQRFAESWGAAYRKQKARAA